MVDSPFCGVPVKAPRCNLAIQKVAVVELGFCGAPGCFQGTGVYIGERSRSVEPLGARESGGRAYPPRARPPALWAPRLLLDAHSKSPGLCLFQKDRSRRFHSIWTPFDIPFLRNTKIGKKTAIWAGPPVSRLVLKKI